MLGILANRLVVRGGAGMIPVIDLFAGPGGLGEGFSSIMDESGKPVFQIIMSVERDAQAHKTLRMRSYLRKILRKDGSAPMAYIRYMQDQSEENREALESYRPELWEEACSEALCAELKDGDDALVIEGKKRLLDYAPSTDMPWVLIGGPPCQAYSLAGRSRRAHDATFEDDVKQTLYKCYLAFIEELKPTVFVMENVKGLLSAQRKGEGVFDRIVADMREAGYEIRSLVKAAARDPRDYIVRAERYGVPQRRHRVILLGVREGCSAPSDILIPRQQRTVRDVLTGIPKIRSGFSQRNKNLDDSDWVEYLSGAIDGILETNEGKQLEDVLRRTQVGSHPKVTHKDRTTGEKGPYDSWYRGRLGMHPVLANHESRSHLAKDLDRYMFCSAFAEQNGEAAKIQDFPRSLYPKHKNLQGIRSGQTIKFNDRFRTQVWDSPSTTITSHISKDGHYYIHPDPSQCRSLTVREAARLQTFPDDYLFMGNRTSQYTQVGNAVPPLLAQQIALVVARFLGKDARGFSDSLSFESFEPCEDDRGNRLF